MHPLIKKLGKPLTKELISMILFEPNLNLAKLNELFKKHKKLRTRSIDHAYANKYENMNYKLYIENDANKTIINMHLSLKDFEQIMEEVNQK